MRKSLAGLLPRTRDDAGPVAREALALGFRFFVLRTDGKGHDRKMVNECGVLMKATETSQTNQGTKCVSVLLYVATPHEGNKGKVGL